MYAHGDKIRCKAAGYVCIPSSPLFSTFYSATHHPSCHGVVFAMLRLSLPRALTTDISYSGAAPSRISCLARLSSTLLPHTCLRGYERSACFQSRKHGLQYQRKPCSKSTFHLMSSLTVRNHGPTSDTRERSNHGVLTKSIADRKRGVLLRGGPSYQSLAAAQMFSGSAQSASDTDLDDRVGSLKVRFCKDLARFEKGALSLAEKEDSDQINSRLFLFLMRRWEYELFPFIVSHNDAQARKLARQVDLLSIIQGSVFADRLMELQLWTPQEREFFLAESEMLRLRTHKNFARCKAMGQARGSLIGFRNLAIIILGFSSVFILIFLLAVFWRLARFVVRKLETWWTDKHW